MKRHIERAAVLGAGTMGAQIAAHLANAGVQCLLLDIVPPGLPGDAPVAERNRVACAGLEAAKKSSPAAFFHRSFAERITLGNFEDDLTHLAKADWIIEAVVEDWEIKRRLLARVAEHRKPGAMVTTNTSGLPVGLIAASLPEEFQQHWAGTHFFNPPRYLRLVELVPGPKTLPDVLETLGEFCDRRLGKRVVIAKDTPNFIANRIGVFSVLNVLRLAASLGMTVEEVDACTGPAIGRPKSATFRTADIVGLDVLVQVTRNVYENAATDEWRETFRVPPLIEEMLRRNLLGEKGGQGFYKRIRKEGASEILALDLNSFEYRPRKAPQFASLEMGKTIDDMRERLRFLLASMLSGEEPSVDPAKADKAPEFLWGTLSETCLYAAQRVPEIADSVVDVDRAMRWGFGWELGPFELLDALGLENFARQIGRAGRELPPLISKLLASGRKTFYESEEGQTRYFDLGTVAFQPVVEPPGMLILESLKKAGREVQRNVGASLIDLGDGVLCCEFHSKMNALSGEAIAMIHAGLERLESDFDALIIANQAANFSVGANLLFLLVAAQEKEWDELHVAVRQFQNVNLAIKYAKKPVVTAPQGMALGGGCEMLLHAARIQATAEAYIGLVETGVGLIPGGGGTKEMLIRANEIAGVAAAFRSARFSPAETDMSLFQTMKSIFETMAMAKVSTSAEEAREDGFLRSTDGISMNRDRLVADAKEAALALARGGYHGAAKSPAEGAVLTQIRVLGEQFLSAAKLAIHLRLRGGYISEYDAHVARKVAYVLAGGELSAPEFVSEQYLLDLERETFVSLCGEKKTQERMAHRLNLNHA
jgi:3-hydroxyacyl-CoA dehydrogenase